MIIKSETRINISVSFVLVTSLLIFLLLHLFSPDKAFAAALEGRFIDKTVIEVTRSNGDKVLFRDSNPYDGNHGYEGGPTSCRHDFRMDNWDSGTVRIDFKGTNEFGDCVVQDSVALVLSELDRREINAYFITNTEIFTPVTLTDRDPGCDAIIDVGNFIGERTPGSWKTASGGGAIYYKNENGNLNRSMRIDALEEHTDHYRADFQLDITGCTTQSGFGTNGRPIYIQKNGPLPSLYDSDSDGRPDNISDTSGDTSEVDLTCEVRLFNPLTWIACPLIEAAQEGVQKFDNAITQRLTIKVGGTEGYMNTSGERGQSFYAAWSAFRYMALIILVIIGLVMVIAQATSAQLFDAYTVKKVMPRIFIAVIAITISWSLMKFAIQLTNEIGIGLRSMLFAPFAGIDSPTIQQGAGSLLGFGALAGVGAGLAGLGMLGMMTFALGALLSVLIGFGVIVFREMLVMLLVVTAPIAIICWIIPGTEKVWKMWSDFLLKALIAFPIITLMITVGHIFAKIAASGGHATLIETTIVFICYFGPYFMIPTAFKLAGGALATVSGMAYGKAQGAFQGLKGIRKKQWGKNMEKIEAGTRVNPNFKLPRMLGGNTKYGSKFTGKNMNRALRAGHTIGTGKAGINPLNMAARTGAYHESGAIKEAEEFGEKSRGWQAMKADDTLAEVAQSTHGQGREAIRKALKAPGGRYSGLQGRELERTVSMIEGVQKEASAETIGIASVFARGASGTGFETHADMYDAVVRATEGNQVLRNNVLAKTKSLSGQNGRPELAGPGHTISEAKAREYAEGPRDAAAREKLNREMRTESLRVMGPHALGGVREEYFGDLATALASDYQDAAADPAKLDEAIDFAGQLASVRGAKGSFPLAHRRKIDEVASSVGVREDLIDPLSGSPYSTDEQLGMALAGYDVHEEIARNQELAVARRLDSGDPRVNRANLTPAQQANRDRLQAAQDSVTQLMRSPEKQAAQQLTQAVRTRAGLYDAGGGNRTPEQIRAAQLADPNQQ